MGILQDRKAIVMGASSGIGYGAALRFAQEGADVVAAARRLENLDKLVQDAKDRGFPGNIIPVACDILKEEDLDHVVKTCAEQLGRIDILACIAQAGMNDQRFTMDTTPENARIFFDGGPVYTLQMIQKCMPYFKEQNYGRIITTASSAAVTNTPGYTGYSMAKAGIMALTRVCATEFAKFGVVTNCFLPVIKAAGYDSSDQARAALQMLQQMIPVGYVGDAYEDSSPVIAFMASEGAHYMNGQFIGIDGGLVPLA